MHVLKYLPAVFISIEKSFQISNSKSAPRRDIHAERTKLYIFVLFGRLLGEILEDMNFKHFFS